MDISSEYIEMCQKAQEIQKLREDIKEIKYGDELLIKEHNSLIKDFNDDFERIIVGTELSISLKGGKIIRDWDFCYEQNEEVLVEKIIWLPHQYQLQEMVKGNLIDKLYEFNSFINPPYITIKTSINKENVEEFRSVWKDFLESSAHSYKVPIFEHETELNYINVGLVKFTSFEQLWLAFVMKTNFNKVWNNKTKEWEVQ